MQTIPNAPGSTSVVAPYRFTVFTKPWKLPLPELGAKMAALGADGVELPVRPGYSVNPDNITEELPRAVRFLRENFGLSVDSIAGNTDAQTIAACGAAGVPLIRVCPGLAQGESYNDGEARHKREWESLVPLLEKANVAIGVQNHSGRFVPVHAMGLSRLVAPFDSRHVCAVWDAAHNALEGEAPDLALDLLHGPHLRMVNLKNGFRKRQNPDETDAPAVWKTFWCRGRDGLAVWPRVADELTKRGWQGVVCLSAEYSETDVVDRLIAEDLAYARQCFANSA